MEKLLRNVQRLLNNHLAILKGYRITVAKCPNNTDTHWANLPNGWVLWKLWEMRPSANKREGSIAQYVAIFVPFL
jgi:hypothetical protein